jgi:photosystem II stability/assembly factor-like uncharacterized protein
MSLSVIPSAARNLQFGVLIGLCATLARSASAQGEGPDHAKRRWEWFYEQRAYPAATIPVGALANARSQLSTMRAMLRVSGNSAPPPISGTKWDPIGPTLIGVRDIGRTSTIAVHPTNANILYIGGAQGGVWKSVDKGSSWTPLTDKQCSLAMGSIAIDPVDPQIVYAATGEQHFSGDSYYGCGVLRSTDGGTSWTQTGAAQFTGGGGHSSRISKVVVVPTGAGTLATTTLFASSDNGLWKSTNGGGTWTLAKAGYMTDVVVADNAGQTVYLAQWGSGVFRSDNGGSTFGGIGLGFPSDSVGRINLALVKTQTNTVLAAVANAQSSALRGIYKTSDAGATWAKLTATNANCSPQCWYDMLIAVHPTDPNVVYFGGVNLYKSVDAGLSFSSVNTGLHADKHFLTFDPQDPTRVYLTSDGGVFKSDNAGASWENLNAGLGITQFYAGISLHPTDPSIVLGGTQDNGTLLTTGSLNWTAVSGGDGGFTAIDYENPLTRYVEFQWPNGLLRQDNGLSSSKNSGISLTDAAQFIPPLVIDPTDPKVLYFGTQKLYRTADRADNWTAISPNFSGTITTIAPAPSNPSMVYVGNNAAQVQVTTNLSTWTLSTSGLPLRVVTDIAVDRTDANTAYVTFSGFNASTAVQGHVFRTVNGGATWTNVSGNLPDIPANAVAVDPVSRGVVMVGTDLGVFISSDSGATWTIVDDGMPNVAVFDIAYNQNTGALIAATHGRGMFKLQLNRPLTLTATPLKRRNDILEGGTTAIPDSSSVILSGVNAGTSGWTATHTAAATWLSFTTSAGTGTGKVKWSRDPTGLAPGLRVDTITLTVAGAIDSPLRIYDTLNVISLTPAISLSAPRRGAALAAGIVTPVPDSVLLTITGGNPNAAWTAVAKTGTWLKVTTPNGVGTGQVRWTVRTDSLLAGIHHDTITVSSSGATGSPATIADSVIVNVAAQLGSFSRTDSLLSGDATLKSASTTVTIFGDPGSTAWTVTHLAGATWTSLTTTAGAGNGPVQWTKNPANLAPGTYYDTISVAVAGAPVQKLPDITVIQAPSVVRSCAVSHYFGTACLTVIQQKYLDLTGNNDGTFNLGDFLSYLARTPALPGPPPAVRGGKP